ncbi:MAG: hypothetical protein GY760_04005 [Deltaproteobacteria bacterium]|nr:hypothetical protein [Deltaproteobacteria bacterium]
MMKFYYDPSDVSVLKDEKGNTLKIKNFMKKLHNLSRESKLKIEEILKGGVVKDIKIKRPPYKIDRNPVNDLVSAVYSNLPSHQDVLIKIVSDYELWQKYRNKVADEFCTGDKDYYLEHPLYPLCLVGNNHIYAMPYHAFSKYLINHGNFSFEDLLKVAENITENEHSFSARKNHSKNEVEKTKGKKIFSENWEFEMMKWPKEEIIKFLKEVSKENIELERKLDLKSREQ